MISICVVGDIFPGGCWAIKDGLTAEIIDYLGKHDLRIANLETAFGDGSTQCHIKMADPKLGNTLFCPDECIETIKKMHIDVVSLANNHACDCDLQGLAHTIELLDTNGIKHFGAGRNKKEAETPAVIEVKGHKIGILGYFPHEWEAPYPPTETEGGLNQYYIEKILADIKQLKQSCDFVFVMPHWGWEYTVCPRTCDMVDAQRMIDVGADGVFGAHTHTVQSVSKYKQGIIAMSLGNFIFPDRYIVSPRQTYYPLREELEGQEIPYTTVFQIVDRLHLHGMPMQSRRGMILTLKLSDNKIDYEKVYTIMDKNNYLVMRRMGVVYRLKLWLISLIMKSHRSILFYKVFYRLRVSLYHRILNKLNVKHPM